MHVKDRDRVHTKDAMHVEKLMLVKEEVMHADGQVKQIKEEVMIVDGGRVHAEKVVVVHPRFQVLLRTGMALAGKNLKWPGGCHRLYLALRSKESAASGDQFDWT